MGSRCATGESFTFDDQAEDFDGRAGLPEAAARRVAAAVYDLAGGGGWIVDMGAGTGEIGTALARGPRPYLGLDLSLPMLTRFRRKLAAQAGGHSLVRADADRPWPIAVGRASVVFLARCAHLLDPGNLVAEARRALAEDAVVVFGSIHREPESLRFEMRRQMRRLLAEHGIEGRSGAGSRRELVEALEKSGGRPLPPTTAAAWPVLECSRTTFEAWKKKPGLAGRVLVPEIRDTVLGRLAAWMQERYGSLDVIRRGKESYRLTAVRWLADSAKASGGRSR